MKTAIIIKVGVGSLPISKAKERVKSIGKLFKKVFGKTSTIVIAVPSTFEITYEVLQVQK